MSDVEKSLKSLLRKAGALEADPFFEVERDGVELLVYSFLLWESTRQRANAAFKRVVDGFVDFNDLRVSKPRDVSALLGKTYPMADERSVRLLTVLNELYQREYEVSLEKVFERSKRDTRKYLDSLEGMTPFVSARVMLYGAGGHAVPVDERLLAILVTSGVVDEGTTVEEATGILERAVRAADGMATADRLQQLSDVGVKAGKSSGKSGSGKGGSKKKTSKKKRTTKKRSSSGAS